MFAALLLMQWVGAPAHCLSMAMLGVDAAVLCHAAVDTTDQPAKHPGGAASLDQACPACHALGYIAPSVAPEVLPQRIAWSASAGHHTAGQL
jgi:hypothetical protein